MERSSSARLSMPVTLTRLREGDGQSFVEFALILPVIAMILFAIVNFGLAFTNHLQITDAARTAARKASVTIGNPCTVMQQYLDANYAGLDVIVDTTDPQTSCLSTVGSKWSAVVKQRTSQTIDLPGLPATLYTYRLSSTVVERKEQ